MHSEAVRRACWMAVRLRCYQAGCAWCASFFRCSCLQGGQRHLHALLPAEGGPSPEGAYTCTAQGEACCRMSGTLR